MAIKQLMRRLIVGSLLLFVLAMSAVAQQTEERKVALIIGNHSYKDQTHFPALDDVPEDAVHVADALKSLGFIVYRDHALINETKAAMESDIQHFISSIQPHSIVFIYFAGHGVEQDRTNYLLPVDASVDSDGSIENALDFDNDILAVAQATKAKATLIVLDACRTPNASVAASSLDKPTRSLPNGIIAYPSGPRRGAISPSPYTKALLSHLTEPGLRIQEIFSKTHDDVSRTTSRLQEPQVFDSLPAIPIYLRPSEPQMQGSLLTSDEKSYFIADANGKRTIPNVRTFGAFGFSPAFALKKTQPELSLLADSSPLPSIDTNLLERNSCVYYMFWAMKWCIPTQADLNDITTLRLSSGNPRPMSDLEDAGIPVGQPEKLPDGLIVWFPRSPGLFKIVAGKLVQIDPAAAGQIRSQDRIVLPEFFRRIFGTGSASSTASPQVPLWPVSTGDYFIDQIDRQLNEFVAVSNIPSDAQFISALRPAFTRPSFLNVHEERPFYRLMYGLCRTQIVLERYLPTRQDPTIAGELNLLIQNLIAMQDIIAADIAKTGFDSQAYCRSRSETLVSYAGNFPHRSAEPEERLSDDTSKRAEFLLTEIHKHLSFLEGQQGQPGGRNR